MKDPAFLFYSKDFYEGTRMMMPEERACYVDLMIYQHQNGIIPDDIKRLKMYCSGVDETTLIATLQAKFERCSEGWKNRKLENVILERQEYIGKQSMNGKIGQFWVKAKSILDAKQYKELRKLIDNKDINDKINLINEYLTDETTLKASLTSMLEHLAIENEINNSTSLNKVEPEKFYKEQLELSNNNPQYRTYIKSLWGENEAGIKLNGILSLEHQMTFEQFTKLIQKAASKKESLTALSLSFENGKYYNGKKSLYLSLNDWLNKR